MAETATSTAAGAHAGDGVAAVLESLDHTPKHVGSVLVRPLEVVAATLLVAIVTLLLAGVTSRYVLSIPVVWIDEAASICFLWLAMLGAAIAIDRNEHLRLTLFIGMLPERLRGLVHAFGLLAVATFLAVMTWPAIDYVIEESYVTSAALNIPSSYRVSAIAFGIVAMLALVLTYAVRTCTLRQLVAAALLIGLVAACFFLLTPVFKTLGYLNIVIFLIGVVALCLVAVVPIAL